MVSYLKDITKKYPIFSIEDGCSEDDWNGWTIKFKFRKKALIVGDDLFVTNKRRLEYGISKNAANSILIKLNQMGSLSETLDINLAQSNKIENIISHRSGETEDLLCNLSVGSNSRLIETGSVARSERAKYNRLIYRKK